MRNITIKRRLLQHFSEAFLQQFNTFFFVWQDTKICRVHKNQSARIDNHTNVVTFCFVFVFYMF